QLERLAGVLALRPDQLFSPGRDGIGDTKEGKAACRGSRAAPRGERLGRDAKSPVDVGRARHRRFGKRLSGGRVYEGGSWAILGVSVAPTDEVLQRTHLAPFLRTA